jgi:organic hydroperoxide reductase OsmC/OhrA
MILLPHEFAVTLVSSRERDVQVSADRLPTLESAAPDQFGGPGDRWSPETLLVAAVGDCFVITFKAMARLAGLPWTFLRCEATGTIDRPDRMLQFTGFHIRATLGVPMDTSKAIALRTLEHAERRCLIAQSLKAPLVLTATIEEAEPACVA